MDTIYIYHDGFARKNGSPDARAGGTVKVIYKNDVVKQFGVSMPEVKTSPHAEMLTCLAACEYVSKLKGRTKQVLPDIIFRGDNKLTYEVISGKSSVDGHRPSKVSAPHLKPIAEELVKFREQNPSIVYELLPREAIVEVIGH